MAVAPHRWLADGHFVKRDGGGKALGVEVPARGFAQREERVEVGVRAGGDVVGGCAAQREVEQHELQLAAAIAADADVLGLDVAVGHAFGFEVVHRLDEFFAKALQHVQRQAALFAHFFQRFGQRLVACRLEQQRGAAGHTERAAIGHDVVVVQLGQHLAFGHQAVVVSHVERDFEDQLFVAAAVLVVDAHQ